MRIAVIALLSMACAHNLRVTDPANWLELRSEHFVYRTDLPPAEAVAGLDALELHRAALIAAGWNGVRETSDVTVVVELASAREMAAFAQREVEGYSGRDAFGQPLVVLAGGDARVLNHELTHVLVSDFLVTQPLWIQEGLAAYMETLRFEDGEVVRGEPRPERIDWLEHHPVRYFEGVIGAGDESLDGSAAAMSSFQSAAWLLVHWMIDTRPRAFEALLSRLGRGENQWVALDAEFPGLHEDTLQAELRQYLRDPGAMGVSRFSHPSWQGPVTVRAMSRAEVYATRAELFGEAPLQGELPDREQRIHAELLRALAEDPGNPLALRLLGGMDATPAIRLHPDDWRAWVLYSDSTNEHWAIEQAARLAPRNAGVLYRLAVSSHNHGDGAEALGEAERALAAGGTRPDVLDAVAQIYAGNGRCEEARSVADRAINSLPASSAAELPARVAVPVQRCDERWAPRAPERSLPMYQAARTPRAPGMDSPVLLRIANGTVSR